MHRKTTLKGTSATFKEGLHFVNEWGLYFTIALRRRGKRLQLTLLLSKNTNFKKEKNAFALSFRTETTSGVDFTPAQVSRSHLKYEKSSQHLTEASEPISCFLTEEDEQRDILAPEFVAG